MKHGKVFVSIIVPIFNMEKYLRRCLESIQKQIFTDFEVILVDDGSGDNSKKICEDFLSDKRFTYIKQENSGVSYARNTGIEMASGTWISFVDPDDCLEREFLQVLTGYCRFADTDIVSCCCKAVDSRQWVCHFFNGNQCFIDKESSDADVPHDFAREKKIELLKQLMYLRYPETEDKGRVTAIGVPWGKLYRKAFIDKYGFRFDRDLIRMQDNIFNMYAFDRARSILYVDKGLYDYSVNHIQGIKLKYDNRICSYAGKIIKLRREYLDKNNLLIDDELYQLYLGEGVMLILEMNRKYFFHPEWNGSFTEKVHKMDEFFSSNIYREIMDNCKKVPKNRLSRPGRIRFLLLRNRSYRLLMVIEKAGRIRCLWENWRKRSVKRSC